MTAWQFEVSASSSTAVIDRIRQRLSHLLVIHPDAPLCAIRLDGCNWTKSTGADEMVIHMGAPLSPNLPFDLFVNADPESDAFLDMQRVVERALPELEAAGVTLGASEQATAMERWVFFVTEALGWNMSGTGRRSRGQIQSMYSFRAVRVPDLVRASLEALDELFPTSAHSRGVPIHSDDFTSVDWFGELHRFSKGRQADAVRVLWENYERRSGFGLSEKVIGAKIDSSASNFRLEHVFRGHPTWSSLIKSVSKGVFALCEPENLDGAEKARSAHHVAHGKDAKLMA